MAELWTKERVLALAPDAASAKAGQGQSSPTSWSMLGRTDQALWGEIKGSGQKPYQVRIDLHAPAFKCSCPSRKFPCKHALGLLLILAEQSTCLAPSDPPDWVNEWLTERDKRAEKREKKSEADASKPVDVVAQAKRAAQRESKIRAGLDELARFVGDVLRQGLASAQSQSPRSWEEMAARMVDAQASGLARLVRELGQTVQSEDGWQSRFLRRAARLNLALQGYSRIETLAPEVQADLRTIVGWTQSRDELLTLPVVVGNWCVVAQQVDEEDRLTVQRTWLLRQPDGAPALLLAFAAGGQPLETAPMVGTVIQAQLIYYPSATPLRAMIKQCEGEPLPLVDIPGIDTIDKALVDFSQAIARNPWLERWPAALSAVTIVPPRSTRQENRGWRLQDQDGRELPVSSRFTDAWTLAAIAGGCPVTVFGEWDGEYFFPYGASTGEAYFALSRRSTRTILARVS